MMTVRDLVEKTNVTGVKSERGLGGFGSSGA